MLLADYEIFKFPLHPSFREMSKKQAQEYFGWFIQQIPLRLRAVQKLIDTQNPSLVSLNFSPESLALLGSWFNTQVKARPLTQTELLQGRAGTPESFHPYIPTDTLTDETLSLCMDLGIYFAETLRYRYQALSWTLLQKPQNSVSFQQPVLVPFRNGHLNPFLIMINIAGDVVSGKNASESIPKLFQTWEGLIAIS